MASTRPLDIKLRLALALLLILIFTDAGYVAYFNSFYSEGTALAFLLIGIGCGLLLIRQPPAGTPLLISYFVAISLMVTSKPQYVPLAPAFGLFGVHLSGYWKKKRRYWVSGALAGALCCLAAWYYTQTPAIMKGHAAYIQLFMDLLPNSSTREQDLSEMGLNPELAAYSGTTPYQPDSPLRKPEFQAEFSAKVTSYTIPVFYLTHPRRMFQLCARCAKHAFSTRVPRLGYYEAYTGKPPRAQACGVWSGIREGVFPRSFVFLCLFFSSAIASAVLFLRARTAPLRSLCGLYVLLVVIAAAQFFVAILAGGGEPDLEKHLFIFNLAFDGCLILLIVGIGHLLQRPRHLKALFTKAP